MQGRRRLYALLDFDGSCSLLLRLELGRLLRNALAELGVLFDVELGLGDVEVILAGPEAAVDELELAFVDGVEAQLVKVVEKPWPVAKVLVDAELVPARERAAKVDVPAGGVLWFF
jgi:hypothetical protein